MPSSILLIIGFACLFVGGRALIQGASSIAEQIGLSRAFVGLVLVGIGTSAPELAFGIGAALDQHGNLVAGNVIGSNIVNIGLALGIAMVIRGMSSSDSYQLFDIASMVLITFVGIYTLLDGSVTRMEGAILLALAVANVVISGLKERNNTSDREPSIPMPDNNTLKSAALLIAGILLLIVGSKFLVIAAVDLASALGVSEAVISLTVTAFGTGIPELTVTAMAAYKREFDIALGNIIGSNIMNIGLVMGSSSLLYPLSQIDIGNTSIIAVIVFTLTMVALLLLRTMNRYAGALFVVGYLFYTYLAFSS